MKPKLHSSGLSTFERCGQQYFRRWINGECIPPGWVMIVGSGLHRAAEADLKAKLATGQLLDVEDVKACARDYIAGEFARGAFWLDGEERKRQSPDAWRDCAIDEVVGLCDVHHRKLAPILNPLSDGVEKKWEIELIGYPMDLAGMTDVIEEAGPRDLKSAGSKPDEEAVHYDTQLSMYALQRFVEKRQVPVKATKDVIVKGSTKVYSLETSRDMDDFKVLLARIEVAMRAIEAGVFVPAPMMSGPRRNWVCTERFCGYWKDCKFRRGHISIAAGGKA